MEATEKIREEIADRIAEPDAYRRLGAISSALFTLSLEGVIGPEEVEERMKKWCEGRPNLTQRLVNQAILMAHGQRLQR